MKLSEYISAERGNASRLAAALGVGLSYVSQMANGTRTVSPARSLQIEGFTAGAVSRKELRCDWNEIWPDLLDAPPRSARRSESQTG
ncbi:transcriptional regulator [Chitinasiproducens palmae]|uniref:transcriptional regulator n=1 Tax=Chitinasiproducens palmae TaxID=1770053 RepID=UPI000B80C176